MRVVLVYIQWFRRSSLLKCMWQPQITKKFTKNPYFGVQGRSRSSMLVPLENSSAVLVMMCSESVSICNRSLARLDDSSRNRVFWMGYPNLMHLYRLLEPRGSNLTPMKSTFNAEHFRTQVVMVYLEWFRRNSLLKCVLQPKITKKSLKTPILGVQGRSRSSRLVPLESLSAVLVTVRSKSVSICNHFHARWANSSKITISKGAPLFDALVRGESLHPVAPNYLIRN